MLETLINQAMTYFFHLLLIGISSTVVWLWRRTKAMQLGMQMLLMDRMLQVHDYYVEQGYMPLHKKDAFLKMYNAYTGLGLDGIMKQPYEEIMSLPTVKPKEVNKVA